MRNRTIEQIKKIVEGEDSHAAKLVWNAAIEAAAEVIDQCNKEGPYQAIAGAKRIRELKK